MDQRIEVVWDTKRRTATSRPRKDTLPRYDGKSVACVVSRSWREHLLPLVFVEPGARGRRDRSMGSISSVKPRRAYGPAALLPCRRYSVKDGTTEMRCFPASEPLIERHSRALPCLPWRVPLRQMALSPILSRLTSPRLATKPREPCRGEACSWPVHRTTCQSHAYLRHSSMSWSPCCICSITRAAASLVKIAMPESLLSIYGTSSHDATLLS